MFTDKFNFLQNKLFELGVIFHFTPVLSKVFDNNFIQNYYWEMVSLVLGTYFCLFLVELRGLWAHLTSISHLTSKPTHNASRHPARWRKWEDAWYRAQEAWPRCRLQAYAGGGYVVACRRFRLRVNPPAKKFDQKPLIKRSRNAIPRPFQP